MRTSLRARTLYALAGLPGPGKRRSLRRQGRPKDSLAGVSRWLAVQKLGDFHFSPVSRRHSTRLGSISFNDLIRAKARIDGGGRSEWSLGRS
jgi:hypothetical protein